MANTPTQQNKGAARAPKKLRLAGLFTDAPVRREPEEPQKVLVAGLAEAREKKEYPDTFFGRAFKIFGGEFMLLLKSSIFFILFTLPFAIILLWFSGFFENLVLADVYNFMGDIGVGFHPSGMGDSLSASVATLYWDVKEPVICMIAATIIFGGLGFSGLFYCAKRSFFQDYYKKTVRTFWMGFAKYWWTFVVCSTVGVLLGLAIATATLYLITLQALGTATAGIYVLVVFTWLIGAPLMLIPMVTLSTYVTYELKFFEALKNSIVIIANSPIMTFIVGVLSLAPLALCLIGNIMQIIIYIAMAAAGSSLIALNWVAMASRGMQKCHVRNLDLEKQRAQARKQEEKLNKKSAPAPEKAKPKKQNAYSNPKKKKKK